MPNSGTDQFFTGTGTSTTCWDQWVREGVSVVPTAHCLVGDSDGCRQNSKKETNFVYFCTNPTLRRKGREQDVNLLVMGTSTTSTGIVVTCYGIIAHTTHNTRDRNSSGRD